MDPVTVTKLILAVAQMAKAAAPLVEQATQVFGSDDADQIKAALAELQAANESLHDRVQAKLRG